MDVRHPVDTSMKYKVTIRFRVDGVVKKDDILGAVFGQLEPLIPRELYAKLQDKNRKDIVIQVDIHQTKGGITEGYVYIFSRLDRYETALLAAATEMIQKVGAFKAEFEVESFDNMYLERVENVKRRAAELLVRYEGDYSLELDLKKLKEDIRELVNELTSKNQIIEYGPDNLPAGPDVEKSDTIIIVEGKNDVHALLKAGYRNAVAMKGAEVPKTLQELVKKKSKVIAFLDRDSQGFKNLDTLLTRIRVDYIALPPEGKREVEDLTPSEIKAALSHLMIPEEFMDMKHKLALGDGYREVKPLIEDLRKLPEDHAIAYDRQLNKIGVYKSIDAAIERKPFAIAYNGHLDQTHISKLLKSGNIPRIIVTREKGEIVFKPVNIAIIPLQRYQR